MKEFTKEDLEQAFNDGRLFEYYSLELEFIGSSKKVFDYWFEEVFSNNDNRNG